MSRRIGSLLFIILTVGIASSISLIGGLGIEVVKEKLLAIVPLLIALPALNSLVGDYATLIAAHAGDPEERTISKRDLAAALAPSILISIVFVLLVSLVLAHQQGFDLDATFVFTFSSFVIGAILGAVALMFLITFALDATLKNRPLNPDDVLIPVVTTISDIFMLSLIALAAWFLF